MSRSSSSSNSRLNLESDYSNELIEEEKVISEENEESFICEDYSNIDVNEI